MAVFKTSDVERERPEEDFTAECESGTVYTFGHPKDLKGDDLIRLNSNDPGGALRILLGDETYFSLIDEPEVDGWVLDEMFNAWAKHFGIDPSSGNGRGSRRPSTGTGKRSKPTSGSRRTGK